MELGKVKDKTLGVRLVYRAKNIDLKKRLPFFLAAVVGFFVFSGGIMSGKEEFKSHRQEDTLGIEELKSLLPEEVASWKALAEDEVYDRETIFDYIDGAGEVYRAYNFRRVLARRFEQPGKPALVADLFDMGSSADAFGVFTHDREGEKLDLGQMAVYKGGLLSFWKDRFFVSVYAEEETPETRKAVLELGRLIDSRIKNKGPLPELVSFLPEEGLIQDEVRYFRSHHILNYHFFVSDEDLLGLGPETEAVLAKYWRGSKKPVFILVVRHAESCLTEAAWKKFNQVYLPESKGSGQLKTEDGTWTVGQIQGRVLMIVFQASTKEEAEELIEKVRRKIKAE